MQTDSAASVLSGVAQLVSALLWPGVFFFGLYYFREELRAFLRNLSEISFKAGGIEATAKRQTEAAALLGAAEATKAEPVGEGAELPAPAEKRARSIAATVQSAVRPAMLRHLSSAVVLWVDDRPSNNTYERRALEALGIRFTLATSTEEALTLLEAETFDAVISDLGRPGDPNAGLTLLTEIAKRGLVVPVVVYAGAAAVRKRESILEHGAYGSTNSPQELFELITRAISGRAPS